MFQTNSANQFKNISAYKTRSSLRQASISDQDAVMKCSGKQRMDEKTLRQITAKSQKQLKKDARTEEVRSRETVEKLYYLRPYSPMVNYREEDGQDDYDSSSDYEPSDDDDEIVSEYDEQDYDSTSDYVPSEEEEDDYDCIDECNSQYEHEDNDYFDLPSMYIPAHLLPKGDTPELPFEKRCFCLHLTRMFKQIESIHDRTERVELIHKAFLFIIYVFDWFLDNFKMDNPKDARLIRMTWRKCDSLLTEILAEISEPGEEPLTQLPNTLEYRNKYPEFYKLWTTIVTVRRSLEAHYTTLEYAL
jgi:hypothetical protein